MSYCSNCGSRLQAGAKYCSQCGAAVPEDSQNEARASESVRPEVSQRRREDGTGNRTGDYVRDGLAALALTISLFTVWHFDGAGTGEFTGGIAASHVDVALVTLLSLASLCIPYLWRAGVFGPAWGYARTQDARLLANVPYFLLVLVYLIIEVVAHPGLGPAVAFGLAGAVLAAQPRSSELAAGDVRRDRRWILVVLALAGLVLVLTVVQILQALVLFDIASMIMITLLALGNVAILVLVSLGVQRGAGSWRLVGIGMGIAAAVIGLLSLDPGFTLTKMTTTAVFPSFSFAFWMAFGAAVAAPSVARLMREPGVGSWSSAVRPVLALAVGIEVLMVVVSVVAVIRISMGGAHFIGTVSPVPYVVALFFGVVGAIGGIVVWSTMGRDRRQGQVLATGYAGLLFVTGLVLVIIWAVLSLGSIAPLTLLLAFVIPAALLVLLWGTSAGRREFAAFSPAGSDRYSFTGIKPERRAPRSKRSVAPEPGADTGSRPISTETPYQVERSAAGSADEAAFAAVTGSTAVLPDLTNAETSAVREADTQVASRDATLKSIRAEAANRRTSAVRLREIASTVPEARAAVASNPKAYPDLLTWLGNLGDPEVDAALQHRKH